MRYAIYFTPPASDPLAQAAATWLGRDPFTETDRLVPDGVDAEAWQALTAEPRRYGFHATLKAPFHLAEGKTEADLVGAFAWFCASTAPVTIPTLTLRALGPFFALVPKDDSTAIDKLCATIVETFEPFRAPLSPEDVARRKPERLTERQRELLDRYGYPHVHEQFRFHMTLTGPVDISQQDAVSTILHDRFSGFLNRPLDVAHLALFAERERGAPFHVLLHQKIAE